MKLISLKSQPVLMALSAVLLSACGSNSGGSAGALVAGTDIPVTATETTAGVVSFANLSAAQSDDAAQPLVVGDAALASTETDEPDPSV